MSAEKLREAARLMRERANAASFTAPWQPDGQDVWHQEADGQVQIVAQRMHEPDAEHIASWHPDVALAVATWLEADASVIERWDLDVEVSQAIVVARAYLGEQP